MAAPERVGDMVTPGSLMAVNLRSDCAIIASCAILAVIHADVPTAGRQRTGELSVLGGIAPRERDADVIVQEGAWWLHPQG